MIVYETVCGSLNVYVCMLFWYRQIHLQLVTALITVFLRYVHTFTSDGLSQHNSDDFNRWVCFAYAIIVFGFGVYFLISG
jgi:hypothetical protein